MNSSIYPISADADLSVILEHLKDCVKGDTYFEIGPRSAKILLDAFVFSTVHNGNLAAAQAHRNAGRLCPVCNVEWPCETAQAFLRKP